MRKWTNKYDKYKEKYIHLQKDITKQLDNLIYELEMDVDNLLQIASKLNEYKSKIKYLEVREPVNIPVNTIVYGLNNNNNRFQLDGNEDVAEKVKAFFEARDKNLQEN